MSANALSSKLILPVLSNSARSNTHKKTVKKTGTENDKMCFYKEKETGSN